MLQLLFLTTSLGCHFSKLSIVHVETTSKPTDLAAPPESLPKFVQCQCKLSFKNPCGTKILSYCNRLSLSQLVETAEVKAVRTLRKMLMKKVVTSSLKTTLCDL